MKRLTLVLLGAFAAASAMAQANWTPARQEIHDDILLSASNYVAYVEPTQALTPAPKGYEPFYLTHYGRHGSRWLIGDWEYTDAMGVLERAHEAGKLTERGELLRRQLNEFYRTTQKRRGELTGVGEDQHHGIGRRMTEHFPEIFGARDAQVDARSTVVIRCILSMTAECEELSKFNPHLSIHNDVSESLQYYLNREPWEQRIRDANNEKWGHVFNYTQAYVQPERFWSVIVNDPDYRDEKIGSRTTVMKRIFDICSNMQSHYGPAAHPVTSARSNDARTVVDGTPLNSYSLYDLFTEEECYNLWRCKNIEWYVSYSSGISPMTQRNLLENFLSTADTCVIAVHDELPIYTDETGKQLRANTRFRGATLRFGHEVVVMPMAALLELGDCYPQIPMEGLDTLDRVWANYRIFPMASNIQLVFYRPKKGKPGDILVKALLNEREVSMPGQPVTGCYYRWEDLRQYYQQKIDEYDGITRLH